MPATTDRRAFTIIELILALGLLAVFCGVFVPVLAAVTRERRIAAQEQAALQHAANLLDELTAKSFAELAKTPDISLDVPQYLKDLLPEVEQTIQTKLAADEPRGVQVTVSVRWRSIGGTSSRPMVLSAWVHATEGSAP